MSNARTAWWLSAATTKRELKSRASQSSQFKIFGHPSRCTLHRASSKCNRHPITKAVFYYSGHSLRSKRSHWVKRNYVLTYTYPSHATINRSKRIWLLTGLSAFRPRHKGYDVETNSLWVLSRHMFRGLGQFIFCGYIEPHKKVLPCTWMHVKGKPLRIS